MNVTLRIRYGQESVRDATAWFIPGSSAAEWLHALVLWQAPLAGVRLCRVGDSTPASNTIGILAVAPSGVTPQGTGRAIGYGVCGGRLYLPIEARFDPEITEPELAALLHSDAHAYVWHPAVGLVEISADEMFAVADLIVAPALGEATWDFAVAGTRLSGRLLSIAPDSPPTLEELWNEAGGDIATQTPQADNLPPSPLEGTGSIVEKLGRSARSGVAHVVHWLAEHAPAGADGPTWIDRLDDWARQQLGRLAASLSAERNREIARLLHMLDNKPDEGLRFALPLAGDAHRGLARPGARLSERDVNFNSRRLGGGGAADVWDIEQEYRVRLSARYRELANREIGLGRYRRAAYIFGELLGDFTAAAATLADGGHYREAAALYKERLHQPQDAARCLKRGGLWTEAIELLAELGEFEQVGDLYRQLDQEDEAVAAYRQAIERKVAVDDYLGAAKLTEEKLHLPNEAFEQLVAGLAGSAQARRCLEESFRLLARQMAHERALALVDEVEGHVGPLRTVPLVVEGLAHVATNYPDVAVRASAADRVRLLAAARLGGASPSDAGTITTAIARLVPSDRLLARDTQRYFQQLILPARNAPRIAVRPTRAPQLQRSLALPKGDWRAAVSTEQAIYAAGYVDDELQMIELSWDGSVRQPSGLGSGKQPAAARALPVLMSVDPYASDNIVLHVMGARPLQHGCNFPARDGVEETVHVGGLQGVSHRTWAIEHDGTGAVYWLDFTEDQTFVINSRSKTQSITSSWDCQPLPEVDANAFSLAFPFPFLVRDGSSYLAIGNCLWQRMPGGAVRWRECPTRIRALVGSPPHTRKRIIAALDAGGVIRWEGIGESELIPFAEELHEPTIGLIRGGWLIAANESRLQVYSTHEGKLRFHAEAAGPGATVFAVLAARHADQFALCTTAGKVLVYQVPTA